MGSRDEIGGYVHLDVKEILRATDHALYLLLADGRAEWIPLSQIADADDYSAGDRNATVSITQWIAQQKGLS